MGEAIWEEDLTWCYDIPHFPRAQHFSIPSAPYYAPCWDLAWEPSSLLLANIWGYQCVKSW